MADQIETCPFCDALPVVKPIAAGMSQIECTACGIWMDGLDDEVLAAWNRRASRVFTKSAPDLAPVDYNKDLGCIVIPLPGGWEIRTKGKGTASSLYNAHQRMHWQVVDEQLHEPLEASARDMRNAILVRDERIRQLEQQLAQRPAAARGDTVLAPLEPTQAMVAAGEMAYRADCHPSGIYKDMLAAIQPDDTSKA